MSKFKLNMIGGGFQHSISSNDLTPKYVEWVKHSHSAPISIYIDDAIKSNVNSETQNYGWLAESRTIIESTYTWARENTSTLKSKFIKVFTHDAELAKISDIFQTTFRWSQVFQSGYPEQSNCHRLSAHLSPHDSATAFRRPAYFQSQRPFE